MSDIAFIVGYSAGSIDTDVRRGHGWKRMSLTSWQNDEGQIVHYLNDPKQLHGIPYGTMVYLAPGYNDRKDWWALDDMMRKRECDRMELDG